MTAGYLLAAYPSALQTLGILTLNNLLGVCLGILLAAHILSSRDLSFLGIPQVVLLAAFAPLLYPDSPWRMVQRPFLEPLAVDGFWFGTDTLGRDIGAGLAHGARVSLLVGIVSTIVALSIGVTLGALAGYYGGLLDDALMRSVLSDTIFSFNTNKRLFNSLLLLNRLQQWQKMLRSLSSASKWTLEEEDRKEYLTLAQQAALSVLAQMEESPFWKADPTGERALGAAQMIRKNLNLLWLDGKLPTAEAETILLELRGRFREGLTRPEELLALAMRMEDSALATVLTGRRTPDYETNDVVVYGSEGRAGVHGHRAQQRPALTCGPGEAHPDVPKVPSHRAAGLREQLFDSCLRHQILAGRREGAAHVADLLDWRL